MKYEETGAVIGTRDKDYDLIWFPQTWLPQSALRVQNALYRAPVPVFI